jgi:hypothetical protein
VERKNLTFDRQWNEVQEYSSWVIPWEGGHQAGFSSPYSPQQNGVVERKNWTFDRYDKNHAWRIQNLDRFWLEEVNMNCHAINQLYLHRLLKKTSNKLGNKPNVSYFRVFGSKCYSLVQRGRNSKFAPKALEGSLLGYDSNTRAYKVFKKSTECVEVSCDVMFDETNGSQEEQVGLERLNEEEAPCTALNNMSIRDVCP